MPALAETPVGPAVSSRWPLRLTRRRLVSAAALAVLAYVGVEAVRVLVGSNFHTVLPGQVYRGAQPTPALIESLVRDYHVKTIINLRGCGTGMPWYVEECAATQKLDIAQEDVCFSAARLPSSTEIRRLVEVIERAEYPIYFHCWRGADRTGLASAMVMLLKTDATLTQALRQLGMRYGHLSFTKTGQLDYFFRLYEDWLAESNLEHTSANFRRWATEVYQGVNCHRFESCERTSGPPRCGQPIVYRIRVRNTGRKPWQIRPHSVGGIHIGYRLWHADGTDLGHGRSALFAAEVAPDEVIELTLVVPPLDRPGRYRLLMDMVQGYYVWFYQTGAEPLEEELDVRE